MLAAETCSSPVSSYRVSLSLPYSPPTLLTVHSVHMLFTKAMYSISICPLSKKGGGAAGRRRVRLVKSQSHVVSREQFVD